MSEELKKYAGQNGFAFEYENEHGFTFEVGVSCFTSFDTAASDFRRRLLEEVADIVGGNRLLSLPSVLKLTNTLLELENGTLSLPTNITCYYADENQNTCGTPLK